MYTSCKVTELRQQSDANSVRSKLRFSVEISLQEWNNNSLERFLNVGDYYHSQCALIRKYSPVTMTTGYQL